MEKNTIAGFNKLLGSVVELITCTQEIKNALHEQIKGSTLREDIFVYHFLRRMADIAASVVIVSKGNRVEIDKVVFGFNEDRFADAALLARSALEGMWGFQAYKKDCSSIARRWHLYTIYENYRRQLRIEKIGHNNVIAAQLAAYRWLNTTYATQHIRAAAAEFDFKEANQTWYD